ncbi:uncharacterized protein LOC144771259 [Lissotriton helveticus]
MERSPFKFCPVCGSKYPHIDVHPVCNKCLSPDHNEENCMACSKFRSKKTLKLRRAVRLEAQRAAPAPDDIFDDPAEEGQSHHLQISPPSTEVQADPEEHVEGQGQDLEYVEEVGDDEEVYGAAEDSSEEELCPESYMTQAQVTGSPLCLTHDPAPLSPAPPSGPATDTPAEPPLRISKPKPKPSESTTPKMADVPPKTKPKPSESTTPKMADVPTKISKPAPSSTPSPSGPPKSKKTVESTAQQKVAKEPSSKKVVHHASSTVVPARSTKAVDTPSDKAAAPASKRTVEAKSTQSHDPKAGGTTHRHTDAGSAATASAPKPTMEPGAVGAEDSSAARSSTPSASDANEHRASGTKPSASFTKQVTDSLKRIREKTLTSTAPTPSAPKPVDTPAKTSTKLLYTLPPKVAPKAFAPKSVPNNTSEEQSEHYIDATTGKLTLYKRKITSQPLESYVIPLKKKRAAQDIPALVEPIQPPPRRSPSPSPNQSGGEDDNQYDQYNFPAANDPDSQQDSYDDTGDQGGHQVVQDPQGFGARTSPTEDSAAFNALIERAAANHDVDMHADPVEEDFLFDTFSVSERTVKTLPMLKGVLKHAPEIFKEPTRARVVNPRIEKKYRPAPGDPAYIRGQLPLDSLVVANARKRANSQTTGEAPPPDKESKVLEASGKRVAAQAANIWRISNTQALLARYDRAHYYTLEQLLQHLPDEFKEAAEMLIQEGKLISNAAIKCALDVADTAARAINSSVMLRRQAWLRISGFKPDIQTTILNQPVNPDRLFGPDVDTTLEKIKKDNETAKSMGALQSQQFRGSTFRRSGARGVTRGHLGQQTQFTKGGAQSPYPKQSRGGYRGNRMPRAEAEETTTPVPLPPTNSDSLSLPPTIQHLSGGDSSSSCQSGHPSPQTGG